MGTVGCNPKRKRGTVSTARYVLGGLTQPKGNPAGFTNLVDTNDPGAEKLPDAR